MDQEKAFLSEEGDRWFTRNSRKTDIEKEQFIARDRVIPVLSNLPFSNEKSVSVVEIGCGQGIRLEHIKKTTNWKTIGIDPSQSAVQYLSEIGIPSLVGTADKLPIEADSVDILIYGFCLYLCDREKLFEIACEANRVLKTKSWIIIIDFWSPTPYSNEYHHRNGLKSFKFRHESLFTWHPSFSVTDHSIRSHNGGMYTDSIDEYVSVTTIRKNSSLNS